MVLCNAVIQSVGTGFGVISRCIPTYRCCDYSNCMVRRSGLAMRSSRDLFHCSQGLEALLLQLVVVHRADQ
jgi:hypothetical protein